MIIRINTITGLIEIEKGDDTKTVPKDQHLIQPNDYNIKRIYYTKHDPEYHRRPIGQSIQREYSGQFKTISKTSRSDKTVKQEPLLDFHY